MFCHKCGNKTAESAGFCYKCGTKIVQSAENTQPKATVEPRQNHAPNNTTLTSEPVVIEKHNTQTSFREFVDSYVQSNTDYKSAGDLLNRSKPLRFVWKCMVGSTLVGLVIGIVAGRGGGAFLGALVGAALGYIISGYTGKIRCRKLKNQYTFSGKVDPDDLVKFLNTNLSYLSSHFGEWENMVDGGKSKISRVIKKGTSKIEKAVNKTLRIHAIEESVRCKFCKNVYAEIKFTYDMDDVPFYSFNAKRKETVLKLILETILEDNLNLGLGEYRCLYKAIPILTAAMEYYFKSITPIINT